MIALMSLATFGGKETGGGRVAGVSAQFVVCTTVL